jgi:hypothetical protein
MSITQRAARPSRAAAGGTRQVAAFGIPKRIPADIQAIVNTSRASTHAAAQWLAGPSEKAMIGASVILISGCQDDQLSMDGAANGLFTEKLKQVWDDGRFGGGYQDFWTAIKSHMPTKQQPNYLTVGAANASFENQTPFEIGTGNGGGSVSPLPEPETPTDGSRPTLRQGATGGDVNYLQRRLREYGYNVEVDSKFGPKTASAVRAFQNANGLVPDGIVGPATWAALG